MEYYVKRDGSNNVVALFKREQTPGQERLDETHPDVLAYLAIDIAENGKIDKINLLKAAIVDQFKFIIEIFEVGKAKGLWVNADFDPVLLQKGAEWKQLINDIEN